MKHIRDQRELDEHSITAEELHSLLTSNQDVLLLDVRQPLDLLAYPEIIPGHIGFRRKKYWRTRH